MTKVQIIGQVTGLDRPTVEKIFKKAEESLVKKGFEVYNPVSQIPWDTPWEQAMKICLKSLLDMDAYLVLPNWYSSKGAQIEYMVAAALQLKEVRL